jgi:hypothetical protein
VRLGEVDAELEATPGQLVLVAGAPQQVGEVVVAGLALGLHLSAFGEHLQGEDGRAPLGQLGVEVAEVPADLDDAEVAARCTFDDQPAHEVAGTESHRAGGRHHRGGAPGAEGRQCGPHRGDGEGAGREGGRC